jgi:RNA polymerase sigma-70 factor (ECF subfamily)
LDNEKKAFLEELFLKNYAAMESYAAHFFQNRDIAQDVVQETFLIAQIKLDTLMASPAPRGWLFNTLKNVIGNTYRQQKRLRQLLPLEDRDRSGPLELPLETKYRALISEEDLRLLIRIYCDGWHYAEAAEQLGISLAACKKRVQRAKGKLKKALEENS